MCGFLDGGVFGAEWAGGCATWGHSLARLHTLVTALSVFWQIVERVERKEQRRRAPPPFITSTLQQEANRKLSLTSKDTMRIAQSLYEAGYITYMRTDNPVGPLLAQRSLPMRAPTSATRSHMIGTYLLQTLDRFSLFSLLFRHHLPSRPSHPFCLGRCCQRRRCTRLASS